MTDEARIKRLTELARQAWPHDDVAVVIASVDVDDSLFVEVQRDEEEESYSLAGVHHPRALDALEAALLVLADYERVPLTPDAVLADRVRALEKQAGTFADKWQAREAKLEKLAEGWSETLTSTTASPAYRPASDNSSTSWPENFER